MRRRFHPIIDPYKKGYLKTTNSYKIYYELYGNKHGIPLVYHHGGPGAAPDRTKARFFSKSKYHICIYHQRGCGKSTPLGIKDNTTQHLVSDAKKLMDFLKWNSAVHYGSSWGTTLALCFAIKYPSFVKSLILCGVFLGTKKECTEIYSTQLKRYAPDAYFYFREGVPKAFLSNPFEYHYQKLFSKNKRESLAAAKLLFAVEGAIMEPGSNLKSAKSYVADLKWDESLRIEPTYMRHNCFLPPDYIVKNLSKIETLPISIVQGRDDYVCPPQYAQKVACKTKNAQLYLVAGGHLASIGEKKQKILDILQTL